MLRSLLVRLCRPYSVVHSHVNASPPDRLAEKKLAPIYEKRRPVISKIPKFWAMAFGQHAELFAYLQNKEDQDAVGYLRDVNVIRDSTESRAFTLEFVSGPILLPRKFLGPLTDLLRPSSPLALQREPLLLRLRPPEGVPVHCPGQCRV